MNVKQLRSYYKKKAEPLEKALAKISARKNKLYQKQEDLYKQIRDKFVAQWVDLPPDEFVNKVTSDKYLLIRAGYLLDESKIHALFNAVRSTISLTEDTGKKTPPELKKVKSFLTKAIVKHFQAMPRKKRVELIRKIANGSYNITDAKRSLSKAERKRFEAQTNKIDQSIKELSDKQFALEAKLRTLNTAISVFSNKISKTLPKRPAKGDSITPVTVPLPTTVSFDEMLDKVVEMTGLKKKSLTKTNLEMSFIHGRTPGAHYVLWNGVALVSRAITPERKCKGIFNVSEDACHKILEDKNGVVKPLVHFLAMDGNGVYYVGFAGKVGVVMVNASMALAIRDFLLVKPVKYIPILDRAVKYVFDKRDVIIKLLLATNVKLRQKLFDKLDNKTQKKLIKAFNVSDVKELHTVLKNVNHYKNAVKDIRNHKGNYGTLGCLSH